MSADSHDFDSVQCATESIDELDRSSDRALPHYFYLVQRLELQRQGRGLRGFDKYFSMEYMGSAEYEWGAADRSTASIRALGDIVVVPYEMVRAGIRREIYFVGPRIGLFYKIIDFERWLQNPYLGSLEPTYFDEAFEGRVQSAATVAWWSLNDNIAWTLNRRIATLLHSGFTLFDQ
ncbi:MAG: hypothetical protein EOO17_02430 [Chloroflexi bacterium]|nr:MAG: hypothetical protein EOO17_02430 [Chloroflexota bacterium]